MHILVIPSWYPASPKDIGGSFFREQALALVKHGFKVGVIYVKLRPLREWRSIFTESFGFIAEEDGDIHTLRYYGTDWLPYSKSMLWIHSGMKLYKRYVKQHGKPDIIHAQSMLYGGVIAKYIHARNRIPYIITEHSTAYSLGLIKPWQKRLMSEAVSRADRLLAVSPPFCDQLNKYYESIKRKWMPMPNIVHQRFTDVHLLNRASTVPDFVFICVAMLTKKKAVYNLISAFSRAFADEPTVTLKIAGDGVERMRLEMLAQSLNVEDRVIFLGPLIREQVVEAVASSDALVLSSSYETFGVVIIEALALGKPVIATRCGGPESIVRKEDGLLVPTNDVNALANAMRALRSSIGRYDAQQLRKGCIARFSDAVVVEQLKQVYIEVLRANQSGC